MSSYSGDGLLWWATKNRCSNLKRPHRKLEDRIKSCEKKGFPIGYKTSGSEYSFTVTDERLEEMAADGTLERLQSSGTQVHGGGDPIYFDLKKKIADVRKTLPNRTLNRYKQMYPYLNLDIWSEIGAKSGGRNWGKDHEATLKFYQEHPDVEFLKLIKEREENPRTGITPRQEMVARVAQEAINVPWEYFVDKIPIIGKILSYSKDQLDEIQDRIVIMQSEEKKVLDERIKPKSTVRLPMTKPFLVPPSSSGRTSESKTISQRDLAKDDAAAATLGISSLIFIALSLL